MLALISLPNRTSATSKENIYKRVHVGVGEDGHGLGVVMRFLFRADFFLVRPVFPRPVVPCCCSWRTARGDEGRNESGESCPAPPEVDRDRVSRLH